MKTKDWVMTNGEFELPICGDCAEPIHSGHHGCTCNKNHPDPCNRPTYEMMRFALEQVRTLVRTPLDGMFRTYVKEAISAGLDSNHYFRAQQENKDFCQWCDQYFVHDRHKRWKE